jgi:hypothetical protein
MILLPDEPESVLIAAYTREQAIEDGTLVDVSKLAKEAGFRFPVAMTAAAWLAAVEVPSQCHPTRMKPADCGTC